MTHDFLNNLDIGFVLTIAGTECMPQIMDREVGNLNRLPMLLFGSLCFAFITSQSDSFYCPVDSVWVIHITTAIQKYKASIAIDYSIPQFF